MTDVASLGGGYGERLPDPSPTVERLLQVARPGGGDARLVIVAGPPGVGKSAVAAGVVERLPDSLWIDKDTVAAGFVLEAARAAGVPPSQAYGTGQYEQRWRPLEYAGSLSLACANLVGSRTVLLVGGWGPELGVDGLWVELTRRLLPSHLIVLHLDAPPLEVWRSRLQTRGSRTDSPWFERFARAVSAPPVWQGAARIDTDRPLGQVVETILAHLGAPD